MAEKDLINKIEALRQNLSDKLQHHKAKMVESLAINEDKVANILNNANETATLESCIDMLDKLMDEAVFDDYFAEVDGVKAKIEARIDQLAVDEKQAAKDVKKQSKRRKRRKADEIDQYLDSVAEIGTRDEIIHSRADIEGFIKAHRHLPVSQRRTLILADRFKALDDDREKRSNIFNGIEKISAFIINHRIRPGSLKDGGTSDALALIQLLSEQYHEKIIKEHFSDEPIITEMTDEEQNAIRGYVLENPTRVFEFQLELRRERAREGETVSEQVNRNEIAHEMLRYIQAHIFLSSDPTLSDSDSVTIAKTIAGAKQEGSETRVSAAMASVLDVISQAREKAEAEPESDSVWLIALKDVANLIRSAPARRGEGRFKTQPKEAKFYESILKADNAMNTNWAIKRPPTACDSA